MVNHCLVSQFHPTYTVEPRLTRKNPKLNYEHFLVLGCPRKLGSMVSKWVISPIYPILKVGYNPLILTIDPNKPNGTFKYLEDHPS